MVRVLGLSLWVIVAGLALAGCTAHSGPALVQTKPGLAAYRQLVFNQSGTLLAAHDAAWGKLNIYKADNLSLITSLKMKMGQPETFYFSPGSKYLIIDSTNRKKVEIWELETCKNEAVVSFNNRKILSHIFSPDEKLFNVLFDDGVIRQWETQNWTQAPERTAPPFWSKIGASKYSYSVFSDDGNLLIVQGKNGLWLWNMQTDSLTFLPNPYGHNIRLTVTKDFTRIAGTYLKGLKFAVGTWEVATGQSVPLADAEFGLFANILLVADFDHASSLIFSPDGKFLAATLASSGPMRRSPESRIWRLDAGDIVWKQVSYDPDWVGLPLVFSPDGKLLAVGGGNIRLFRTEDIFSQGGLR